jgi:hypothetical protein
LGQTPLAYIHRQLLVEGHFLDKAALAVVIDADSPEEAMLKLRDAGLEPALIRFGQGVLAKTRQC